MRKIKFDKKYLKLSIYAFGVLAALIILEKILGNSASIFNGIKSALGYVMHVLMPFVYGFVIAYFLNTPVRFIERKIFLKFDFFKNKRKKMARLLSAALIYVIAIGAVAWIVAYLIPEIISSIQTLVTTIRDVGTSSEGIPMEDTLKGFLDEINAILSTNFTTKDIFNSALDPIVAALSSIPNITKDLFDRTMSFAAGFFNVILGLVIAFYMLCEKENLAGFSKKTLFVIFSRKFSTRVVSLAKRSNTVFEGFVVGQALDATIVGLIFLLFARIFNLPYYALLSLIIGVTNLIPFFGPFIGGIPVTLIVLINNPMLGIGTGVFIIILQQFDGNVLCPRILANSTGLKPIGVIFAIVVGGAFFGIAGMFFGVPVFAVVSSAISMFIEDKYRKKQIAAQISDNNDSIDEDNDTDE